MLGHQPTSPKKGLTSGKSRWRQLTGICSGSAKPVFHFEVQGSLATSTRDGIAWLAFMREQLDPRVRFWPFGGWRKPDGCCVIAETYPSLWSRGFTGAGRTNDEHDANCIEAWPPRAGHDGSLSDVLKPMLLLEERNLAELDSWIAGSWAFPASKPKGAQRGVSARRAMLLRHKYLIFNGFRANPRAGLGPAGDCPIAAKDLALAA